ncbi:hypothetical protein L345_03048, partial [Ophiophagus hannah]
MARVPLLNSNKAFLNGHVEDRSPLWTDGICKREREGGERHPRGFWSSCYEMHIVSLLTAHPSQTFRGCLSGGGGRTLLNVRQKLMYNQKCRLLSAGRPLAKSYYVAPIETALNFSDKREVGKKGRGEKKRG